MIREPLLEGVLSPEREQSIYVVVERRDETETVRHPCVYCAYRRALRRETA